MSTQTTDRFLRVREAGEAAQYPGDLRFDKDATVILEDGEHELSTFSIIGLGATRHDPQATPNTSIPWARTAPAIKLILTDRRLIWHFPPVSHQRKKQGSALGDQFVYGAGLGSVVWASKKLARKATEKPPTIESGQVRLEHIAGVTLSTDSGVVRAKLITSDNDTTDATTSISLGRPGEPGPFANPIVRAIAQRQLLLCAAYLDDPAFADAKQRLTGHVEKPTFGTYPNGDMLFRLQGYFSLTGSEPRTIVQARAKSAQ